jgi:hypothetical protein
MKYRTPAVLGSQRKNCSSAGDQFEVLYCITHKPKKREVEYYEDTTNICRKEEKL